MLKNHRPQSHMSTWLFHVNIGHMENTGLILCLFFFSFSEVGCINSRLYECLLYHARREQKMSDFFLVPHGILFIVAWLLYAWKTLCNEVQPVSLSHGCSCHDSFQQQSHHNEHCTSYCTVHPSLVCNFYFSEHLYDCSTTLKKYSWQRSLSHRIMFTFPLGLPREQCVSVFPMWQNSMLAPSASQWGEFQTVPGQQGHRDYQ